MNSEQSENVQNLITEGKESSTTSPQLEVSHQTKKSQIGSNSSQNPTACNSQKHKIPKDQTQGKSPFYKIQSKLEINKQKKQKAEYLKTIEIDKQKAEYIKNYVERKELEHSTQRMKRQLTQKQQLLQRILRKYAFWSKMSQEHAKSRIIKEFKNKLVQDLNYLSNQYRSCQLIRKNTQEQCSAKKQEWQKEAEQSYQKAINVRTLENLSPLIDEIKQTRNLQQINFENIETKINNINREFELKNQQISATLQKNQCVKEIVPENRPLIEQQLTKKQKHVVVGLADIKTIMMKYFRQLGRKNVWGQWSKQTKTRYLEMWNFNRYFVKEQMYQQQLENKKENFYGPRQYLLTLWDCIFQNQQQQLRHYPAIKQYIKTKDARNVKIVLNDLLAKTQQAFKDFQKSHWMDFMNQDELDLWIKEGLFVKIKIMMDGYGCVVLEQDYKQISSIVEKLEEQITLYKTVLCNIAQLLQKMRGKLVNSGLKSMKKISKGIQILEKMYEQATIQRIERSLKIR